MPNDVSEWLEKLGLGQYASNFADNDIGTKLLVQLTDVDLKELGISSLGHRKTILSAIETLSQNESEPTSTITAKSESERRQLTVMFCDLVGSTELSQRFDPEDLQKLIASYQGACNAAIERFDGYVARYMGDGMLVYFGYPVAHEDDAERAVRAGLNIIEEVASLVLSYEIELTARIGIATGLVVAGDIIGEGASEERAVLGETPNLAARMQGIAPPGEVIIADSTRRLVEGRVEIEALRPVSLKGFSEPIQAFRVIEIHAASRFDAATSESLTPFVGRRSELNLLSDRWQQACSGDGQVVLLSGEAGIGKSRILHELRNLLRTNPYISIRYQCSPFNTNTPFYPIIEQLRSSAGFIKNDTDDDKLYKLEYLIRETLGNIDIHAPLIADLMSLPVDRYPQLDLTPTKQKIETITVLVDYLVKFSHNSSVIVLVEDIHWIDPSTLEVFDAFVDSLQQLQVLLVMTHRPGLEKRWQEFGHVTHHSLNRLGHKEMRALVDRITDGKALPENVLEQILERTDGMPLFVEELIKTLLESQVVREVDGRYVIESVLPSMAIPTTLRDSLMARLDRLGLVKEVAQAAACIGREFSYALLTSIVDTDDLDDKLDQLVGAGLIFRRGSRDLARFVFKHALVQDAAYESLLKTKRRNLHARIAKLLEEEFSDKAEIEPELLAHHYTEAGLDEPALQYWLRAGQQSIKQCAHAEAIAHLRRGLSIVDALPEGEEKTRSEIEFRVVLGVPLMGKEGGASPLVDENYLRAQMLCEQLGESEHLYPILWGLWYHRYLSSELRQACELADRLLEIGQIRNDTELLLEAHHCQWVVRFIGGDLTTALEECDRGVELYRPETHHALSFTYGGHDPGVCALNFSGVSLWLLGYPEQSLEKLESAISLATKLAHSETLTTTFQFFLVACTLQRDEDVIEQKAKELLKFAEDEELFDSINLTKGLIGLVMFQRGDKQEGLEFMLESVGRWLKKSSPWSAVSISLVAESLGQMGEATKGLKMVEDTISLGQRREVHWCEAELYRVKGKLLLSISTEAPSGAEDAFQRAIEIAREQNAKSLELRAAVDLARLWKAGEKTDQARELLRPIYDWFTEGFDTTDLRQAKALLEELT